MARKARTQHQAVKSPPVGRLQAAKVAANELGIPYTSLRDAVFRGELPVVRIGRAWYFERADLTQFVEQHTSRMGA